METLLIDRSLIESADSSSDSPSQFFPRLCNELKRNGVQLFSGPELSQMLTFGPPPAKSLKTEYGALACTLEVVNGVDGAVDYINRNGSGHTDAIVTENSELLLLLFEQFPGSFSWNLSRELSL